MPRVVPDQKNKFDTDELFKKLNQECDVSESVVCQSPSPLVPDLLDFFRVAGSVIPYPRVQVKYTGFKDKSPEERKQRFVQDLVEGHSVIVSVALITRAISRVYVG